MISERFESPISIVAYVGSVGVGKSKLASLTVETLYQARYNSPSRPFRSGAGAAGVTHGIWMWKEPMRHPGSEQEGSILVLDCEGMGELDEGTSANLYLFCMVMSTVFAVVLRPPRIDRFLSERLYNALRRFQDMRTSYVLPNLYLVAMDMPSFMRSDPTMGDIQISKDDWLKDVFGYTSETLSQQENNSILMRYQFITAFLPAIDAVNVDHLPRLLMNNSYNLDIHTVLRQDLHRDFYTSLERAIEKLLSHGGKRLVESQHSSLFIRPAELTALMSDLVDVLNENKMPNADALINRYLLKRFMDEIVEEQLAEFREKMLQYAHKIIGAAISAREIPATSDETKAEDDQMQAERDRLTTIYLSAMIRLARHQIYRLDEILLNDYGDMNEQDKALLELPTVVQLAFEDIKRTMNDYREPESFVRMLRENSVIKDLHRQQAEQRKLLQEMMAKLEIKRDLLDREKRINNSLKSPKSVRIGLAPCTTPNCGRPGGAINYVHSKKHCPAKRNGNYYYYHNEDNRMVCDACRQVLKIDEQRVDCSRCGRPRKVTRIFKFNE